MRAAGGRVGVRRDLLPAANLQIPAASAELTSLGGCITYWGFADTTASTGSVFNLYDGSNANGRLIFPGTTLANQSFSDWAGLHAIPFYSGLYFQLVSGTVKGAVIVRLGHACMDGVTDPALSGS